MAKKRGRKKGTKNVPAIRKPTAPAKVNVSARGTSLENINPDTDITLPRIKLLQPMSDEVNSFGAKPGQFFNKVTQDQEKELIIVPCYLFKQRLLFDKDTMDLNCMSRDSLISSQGLHDGDVCQSCEESKWTENKKNGKKLPPPCMLSNNFLSYTADDLTKLKKGVFVFPKVLSFGKTSFACSKEIISTVLFQGRELFDFKFTLTTAKRQKDKFTYFVPVIDTYSETDAKVVAFIKKLVPSLRSLIGRIEIEKADLGDAD